MTFRQSFGSRLRAARRQAGITQRDLAARIGVSPACLSMYEHGKRLPNIETASAAAAALGIPFSRLVCDDPYSELESGILGLVQKARLYDGMSDGS